MAELGLDTRYNLIDNLKLVQDGKFTPWAETLTENNPFLFDLAITPANGISRVFSYAEAVTGQIYLAVLVARLVGLQIAQTLERKE